MAVIHSVVLHKTIISLLAFSESCRNINSLHEETKGVVLGYPLRVTCQGVLSPRRIPRVPPSLIESRHHWPKQGEQEKRGGPEQTRVKTKIKT